MLAPALRGKLYKLHESKTLANSMSGQLGSRYVEADDSLSVLYIFKDKKAMHLRTPNYTYSFSDVSVRELTHTSGKLAGGRVDKGAHKWITCAGSFSLSIADADATCVTLGCEEEASVERWLTGLRERAGATSSVRLTVVPDTSRGVEMLANAYPVELEVVITRGDDGLYGLKLEEKDGERHPAITKVTCGDDRIEPGDLVLEINGRACHSVGAAIKDLARGLPSAPDSSRLNLRRKPQLDAIRVQQQLGLTLTNLSWSPIGVDVAHVEAGSPAYKAVHMHEEGGEADARRIINAFRKKWHPDRTEYTYRALVSEVLKIFNEAVSDVGL